LSFRFFKLTNKSFNHSSEVGVPVFFPD